MLLAIDFAVVIKELSVIYANSMEKVCNLKVSKQLKELGFDKLTEKCYDTKLLNINKDGLCDSYGFANHNACGPEIISAPETLEARDWICQKYGLFIDIILLMPLYGFKLDNGETDGIAYYDRNCCENAAISFCCDKINEYKLKGELLT